VINLTKLDKTPINTLVLKGDCFSHNDVRKLENRKLSLEDNKVFGPVNMKIVLVYPSGHTSTIQTNTRLFDIITDGDKDCIIYGEMSLNWECGNCDETFPYTDNRHKLLITDVDGTQTKGWLCSHCAERDWGVENV
jgi:hypothetical protein